MSELLLLPVLTVGRSSAEAARAAGFVNVESADGDGEDLVRQVATRFAGVTKPLHLRRVHDARNDAFFFRLECDEAVDRIA